MRITSIDRLDADASGDGWARSTGGEVRWGIYGAAGLLLHDPERGVLLQRRSLFVHGGGTWSIPGGARHANESAADAAFREAEEEAGIPREACAVLTQHVLDLGWWSYTTVVADTVPGAVIDAVATDWESAGVAWVPVGEVAGGSLHPGFAASWPDLHRLLLTRTEVAP